MGLLAGSAVNGSRPARRCRAPIIQAWALDVEEPCKADWPGAGRGQKFQFARVVESGDEVLVTYEMTQSDGSRGRNTEVLTFKGEQVCRAEVYFGWNL